MLTFLCVLNTKNPNSSNPKDRFLKNHVYDLKHSIEKFYTSKHNFYCLSDVKLDFCEYIPLTDNNYGYWAKLELFKHDLGKCIYFDLDVIIQKNIDWLDEINIDKNNFWTINCNLNKKSMNSSLMCWEGKIEQIYKDFNKNFIANGDEYATLKPSEMIYKYGDQSWIYDQLTNTDIKINFVKKNIEHIQFACLEDIQKADIIFLSGTNRKKDFEYSEYYKSYIKTNNINEFSLLFYHDNLNVIKQVMKLKKIEITEKNILTFIITFLKIKLNFIKEIELECYDFKNQKVKIFKRLDPFRYFYTNDIVSCLSIFMSMSSPNLIKSMEHNLKRYEKKLEEINKQ